MGLTLNIINENISSDKITGGIVLTGGGSLINGLSQLGEYLLAKPIKIGYPKPFGGMTNIMQNPKFSTVLGLLHWELDQEKNQRPTEDWEASHDILGKLGHSLKTVFKDIF